MNSVYQDDDDDDNKQVMNSANQLTKKKKVYRYESVEDYEKRFQLRREHARLVSEQRNKEEKERRDEIDKKRKEAEEEKRQEMEAKRNAERFERYKNNLGYAFAYLPQKPGVKKSVGGVIAEFFDSRLYFAVLLVIVSVSGMFATKKILRLEKIDFLYGLEFVSYYLYFVLFVFLLTQTLEAGALKTFVHLTCILTVANLWLTSVSNDIAARVCDYRDSCFWYTGLHTPEVSSPVWVFTDPFDGNRSSTLTPEETENLAHRIWFSLISEVKLVPKLWDLRFNDKLEYFFWLIDGFYKYTFGWFLPLITTKTLLQISILFVVYLFGSQVVNVISGVTRNKFVVDLLTLALSIFILFLFFGEEIGFSVVNVLYILFGLVPDLVYRKAANRVLEMNRLNNKLLLDSERKLLPSANSSSEFSQLIGFHRGGNKFVSTVTSFVVALTNPLFPGEGSRLSNWLINTRGPRVVVWPRNKTTGEFFLASGLFSTVDEFAAYVEYMDGNTAAYDKVLENYSKMVFYDELLQQGTRPSQFVADNYLKMFPYTSPFSFTMFKYVSPLDTCVPRDALPVFYGMSYAKQLWLAQSCRENSDVFLEKHTKDAFRTGLMKELIPEQLFANSVEKFKAREKFFFTFARIETHRDKFESLGFNIPPFPVAVEQFSFAGSKYLQSMVSGRKAEIIRKAYYILDG